MSLSREIPPTKVVGIEPILGSIKYEARSHYHSVFRGDHIHSRVLQCSVKSPFISVREINMVTSSSSNKSRWIRLCENQDRENMSASIFAFY